MTGKLTRQGSARRAALLDAAEAVLVAKGNADASLRAVAAEAGVRLGHLQHYFPTRADLVRAVLERALDRSLERLTGPAGLTGPDRAEPAEAVAVVLAEQDDPHLVRLFVEVWALAARDEAIAEAVRAFYRRYADHVAAYVRALRPEWSAEHCRVRAETFVALVEGASLLRSGIAGHRSAATDAYLVEAAVRLLRD
ncbi:TetR/AcrR family transcriptional regulator [Streptomyces mobaraensis]|uniref:TetR/AcrR family transcriptional regulator n=1 Tax=Streptomyces mobaraensis TaxID=35621 RepID=UPI0033304D48